MWQICGYFTQRVQDTTKKITVNFLQVASQNMLYLWPGNFKRIGMKRLLLSIVSWFVIFGGNAQENYSTEKLIKDYDIFCNIFEKANAGLYKYHSKKKLIVYLLQTETL